MKKLQRFQARRVRYYYGLAGRSIDGSRTTRGPKPIIAHRNTDEMQNDDVCYMLLYGCAARRLTIVGITELNRWIYVDSGILFTTLRKNLFFWLPAVVGFWGNCDLIWSVMMAIWISYFDGETCSHLFFCLGRRFAVFLFYLTQFYDHDEQSIANDAW